jgi:signal transduction histidine kinase
LITLIAVATTVLALTLQHVQTASLLDLELDHLIDGEADALTLIYRDGGLASLSSHIDEELISDQRDVVYMLAGADRRHLAGNVLRWPTELVGGTVATISVPVKRGDTVESQLVEGKSRTLGNNAHLFVGHLADSRVALGRKYRISLITSVAITAGLSLALGWIVSRRGLRFIKQAAEIGDRFLAGHLDERLQVSERDDEFDRLSEVVNACFDEIERMVGSLRAATDGLAHDLKTPLTRIKARIELAALRGQTSPESELLAETARDLDAMLELINGLLALARAGAATSDSFEALDLATVVREAIDLYAPLAEDKGCRLVIALTAAPMRGVRALLLHMVANLIDNAIKHSPSGGGNIVLTTSSDGTFARFSVADNGHGIPIGLRNRAMQRFGRLDESRSSPGSGLGLALVQTVARVHRGRIALSDNSPGLIAELSFDTKLK